MAYGKKMKAMPKGKRKPTKKKRPLPPQEQGRRNMGKARENELTRTRTSRARNNAQRYYATSLVRRGIAQPMADPTYRSRSRRMR